MSMIQKITSPAPRAEWQRLFNCDPGALIFQSPDWTDALVASGEWQDASRLYELADGRKLLLPLAVRRSPVGALRIRASMPHGWGSGGPLSDGPLTADTLAAVSMDLQNISASGAPLTLRPQPLTGPLWRQIMPAGSAGAPKTTQRICHILSLEGGFDHYWTKVLRTEDRTRIRRSEKNGLTVETAEGSQLMPVYHQMYLRWIDQRAQERKMPLPLAHALANWREPLSRYTKIADVIGSRFHVYVARMDGRLAAAAILIIHGDWAIYWRSASDRQLARQTRANDLLQKMMIEAACQAGCRYYHMGESGGVPSLVQFKERFGAQPYTYDEYSFGRLPVAVWQERFGRWLRNMEKRALAQEGEGKR